VALRRIAAQYPGTANAARCIPYAEDVRRGLAMASADILPLVVLSAATPEARAQLEAALAPLAWSGEFVGKLAWAPAATAEDLMAIAGAAAGSRVLVIQPDTFGQQGKVLAETAATDAAGLRAVLAAGLARFVPESKDSMRHVKEGERRGVHWEGEIPVTDPGGRR
ncbi:MAG: hypothetical protein HZA54_07450, partial [Planctomycetes bacterium]|nr:hypothetical protein [Planctomycetota bacterium]